MLECLEEARKRIAESTGEERIAAMQHYRTVLAQFNELVLKAKVPPEEPCYM